MRVLVTIIVLAWAASGGGARQAARGQGHDQDAASHAYVHDVWQTEDGLPHNSINAVLQTRDGYLWLGTAVGLVRFDGARFVVVDDQQAPHLQESYIWALYEDREGGLWIGSGNGLSRLAGGRFTTYTTAEGLSNNFVRAICQDAQGALWIGTYGGGLNRLEEGRFTAYTTAEGLADNFVNALYEDRSGALWVGTGGGLSRLEGGRVTPYAAAAGLAGDDVRAVLEDREGRLWIGTRDGLYRFDGTRFLAVRGAAGAPLGPVRAIYQDAEGALWIGTEADGLVRLRDAVPAPYTATAPLSHGDVRSLYQDREGSLWIGTNGGGLNRFKRARFAVYGAEEGLPNNVVFSVYQDPQGTVWIGSNGGLSRFRDGRFTTFTARDGLSNEAVFSLVADRSGALWVGTNGGGLNRFQDGAFTVYGGEDGLAGDVVFSLYEDREGRLWIGTGSGLNRFDGGAFTTYTRADGLAGGLVVALLQDREGRLWIGTDTGLSRFKDGAFTTYTTEDGLSSNFIRALYEDGQGILWVGTRGGLNRFDGERFTVYTTRQGLFGNVVYQILEDGGGTLWMSGDRGLFRVRKQELEAYARGDRDAVTSVAYGKADGMRSSEGVGGTQPAGWKTDDGRLWFPTLNGVVVVDPDRIQTNSRPPPVHVEDLVVDDTLAVVDGATLPPGARRFEFRYTGLSYVAPHKVTFKYRLEPNDADWIDAGTERSATYTNLSPGAYTFRVIAGNNDGVWNEEGDALAFTLRPYFYQTPWFFGLCALILLFAGAGAFKLRVRHLKAREKELVRLVDERTQRLQEEKEKTEAQARELEAQARKLVEMDRAKSRFFTNVSHEFRTPVTLIVGPLEDVLAGEHGPVSEQVKDPLGVTLDNARRLHRLVNQLLDLSKLEVGKLALTPTRRDAVDFLRGVVASFSPLADRNQITLRFNAEREELRLFFDQDVLEKVASNLLSNALKFTPPGGKVWVTAGGTAPEASDPPGGVLTIVVKDTGSGIAEEDLPYVFDRFHRVGGSLTRRQEGTGIGLALVKELVALHGGRVDAASEPGFGSTFTVHLHALEPPDETVEAVAAPPAGRSPDSFREAGDEARATGATPSTEAAGAPSTEAATVLVVEDHADVRAYIKQHLQATYRVLEAENGADGLHLARERLPDLIVSDVMMPELDGYSLCRQIKSDARTSHIPVILLTARASEEGTLEGLQHGADDYVHKPFSIRELEARVQNLIAVRHGLRRRYSREVVVQPAGISVPSSDEAFLERAIAVVEDNMADETFGVDALAAEVGLSPRHLQRKLRTLTGQSPSVFIRRLRLQRAAQLLEQQAGTVAEIAYAVGFKKPSYFSELFRKTYGTPPSEYGGDDG